MNTKYTPKECREIERAVVYMVKHFLVCQRNKKPIILHSIKVGNKLMDLEQDKNLVIAGLLHDLVEDSDCTIEEIKKDFGSRVAKIVAALTFDKATKNYKKRTQGLIRKIIKAGKGAMLVKTIDQLNNLPYYIFTASNKKCEELIWKHKFTINSFEKYLKNQKVFEEYKNLFDKIKK